MQTDHHLRLTNLHVIPIAASILAALALNVAPHTAVAATIPVTSCADDGGADELHFAALKANTTDIIDLSQLTCSRITLANGEINLDQDGITIKGPGQNALIIDGLYTSVMP
jgi:hypothetical protein